MPDRKPLIVLGGLALLVIVLFVVGVMGAGRGSDADGLPEWATPGSSPGEPLTADDLSGSSSCSFGEATITFTGVCRVGVREITGGWPWQAATRRAILTVGDAPVALGVTLAGKALRADLDAGDDIRLTYTREGGEFVLGCGGPTGCVVFLSEDS